MLSFLIRSVFLQSNIKTRSFFSFSSFYLSASRESKVLQFFSSPKTLYSNFYKNYVKNLVWIKELVELNSAQGFSLRISFLLKTKLLSLDIVHEWKLFWDKVGKSESGQKYINARWLQWHYCSFLTTTIVIIFASTISNLDLSLNRLKQDNADSMWPAASKRHWLALPRSG